jgi:dipeptidyl aminopeptidase/acylaminoacyl peptidase
LSPSTYVDRIKMPIFIVYSGKDEVVYPSQNIRAILELSANGNTPESLYLTEEGHFPENISSRKMIISHLSEFLNNNIN